MASADRSISASVVRFTAASAGARYYGPGIHRENIDAVLNAYDDSGIRSLVGFAMMDKPIVDNFPFVESNFPPELAAELRQARPPAADDCVRLMRDLARDSPVQGE